MNRAFYFLLPIKNEVVTDGLQPPVVLPGDPQALLPEADGDHVSVRGVDRRHPAVQQRQAGGPHHVPPRCRLKGTVAPETMLPAVHTHTTQDQVMGWNSIKMGRNKMEWKGIEWDGIE